MQCSFYLIQQLYQLAHPTAAPMDVASTAPAFVRRDGRALDAT